MKFEPAKHKAARFISLALSEISVGDVLKRNTGEIYLVLAAITNYVWLLKNSNNPEKWEMRCLSCDLDAKEYSHFGHCVELTAKYEEQE